MRCSRRDVSVDLAAPTIRATVESALLYRWCCVRGEPPLPHHSLKSLDRRTERLPSRLSARARCCCIQLLRSSGCCQNAWHTRIARSNLTYCIMHSMSPEPNLANLPYVLRSDESGLHAAEKDAC